MKVNNQVHLIRKSFFVTPEVKRYVNIYLLVGKYCYLVDCGVSGTQNLIEEYLKSLNKKLTDIKGIFLTHSHPDHIGAAAEIKRKTGCKIYAPIEELPWIEDVQKQFLERPIPAANDLPIFVDYEQTVKSLDNLQNIAGIEYYCPAWDDVYTKEKLALVMKNSKEMLLRLKNTVIQIEREYEDALEEEKVMEVCKRMNMLKFLGNPLFIKSIEACRREL